MDVTRCDLPGILLQEELSTDGEPAAAVVGNQAGGANRRRRGNFILGAKGKDIANHRNDTRTDRRTRYGKRCDDKCPASAELLLFFRRLLRLWGCGRRLLLLCCRPGRILLGCCAGRCRRHRLILLTGAAGAESEISDAEEQNAQKTPSQDPRRAASHAVS